MGLDVSTVLLQWATGGLVFLWMTVRRRVVGLGYGWLLRGVYAALALGALVAGLFASDGGTAPIVRDVAAAVVAIAATCALAVSVTRRGRPDEVPVAMDLVAPTAGVVGVAAAAFVVGGDDPLGMLRLGSGVLLMGAVTDAMLLGHWYLVQPGLARDPLRELVRWSMVAWALSFLAWVIPEGGLQVIAGTVDDGWDGLLGWTWLVCALTTIGLVTATWLALRERSYTAVMAATGLLYLAIMTAFGMDIVPRAVLAP